MVESAWPEDMGQFLYHLDPDTRIITKILEKMKLEIMNKQRSIVFNKTCLKKNLYTYICLCVCVCVHLTMFCILPVVKYIHTHTYTHTYVYIYIYIDVCECVCVCVCVFLRVFASMGVFLLSGIYR